MKDEIYIYKITNKKNNKTYIGQTINYNKRISEHLCGRKKGNNSIIDKAIKKHGKDNFICELIDKTNNQDHADELERLYIKEFECLKPKGYNILIGGRKQQGAWNQRKVYMYNLNGEFEEEFDSASQAERLSNFFYEHGNITLNCRGKTKRCKDKIFSFEKHDNIPPYKRKESHRKRRIYQFDKNGNILNSFDSLKNASIKTNTCRTTISGCLNGVYKYANGFIWSYHDCCKIPNKNQKRTEIVQYDKNMNFIAEYVSCAEAERALGLKKNAYKVIWKRLNDYKLTYGYYWFKR